MNELLPITRDGVTLRRLHPSDLRDFQRYRCDPVVGLYQGWSASTDIEAEGFLEVMSKSALFEANDWTQLAIANAETNTLIGDIGIHIDKDEGTAEIGFTLSPSQQRRGVATIAVRLTIELIFRHTRVMGIVATTDARNERSIRLLERIGMQRVASREAIFRGAPCIEHSYRLERTECLQPLPG